MSSDREADAGASQRAARRAGGEHGRGPHVHARRGCAQGAAAAGRHQGPARRRAVRRRRLPQGQVLPARLLLALFESQGLLQVLLLHT